MEHADLASLTMFIETFARKHNLIPRELLPKWVASERDVPPNYGQPAFHWESARANFEAPLGNKDGGLHLSLTAQTVQHTEGDQEDYSKTIIRVLNFGDIDNGQFKLATPYKVAFDLNLFGDDPNKTNTLSFGYTGGLDAFGERIDASHFGGFQIKYWPKAIGQDQDVLFAEGRRLHKAAIEVEHRFPGLDLSNLARLDITTKIFPLMTHLANDGIVASTPKEFWRIFSVDAIK
jgi:hypothetical protein